MRRQIDDARGKIADINRVIAKVSIPMEATIVGSCVDCNAATCGRFSRAMGVARLFTGWMLPRDVSHDGTLTEMVIAPIPMGITRRR